MKTSVAKPFWFAAVILLLFGGAMILFDPHYQSESTLSRREVPYLLADSKMYTDDSDQAASPIVIPEANSGPAKYEDVEGWQQRLQILGERAKPTALGLCQEIAPGMIDFTKEASSGGTEPYMTAISNITAKADFRKTFPLPGPGEKVVMLQCRALIQYSINLEAETDYYLMIDSEGNTRLRYSPDNNTTRKIN